MNQASQNLSGDHLRFALILSIETRDCYFRARKWVCKQRGLQSKSKAAADQRVIGTGVERSVSARAAQAAPNGESLLSGHVWLLRRKRNLHVTVRVMPHGTLKPNSKNRHAKAGPEERLKSLAHCLAEALSRVETQESKESQRVDSPQI